MFCAGDTLNGALVFCAGGMLNGAMFSVLKAVFYFSYTFSVIAEVLTDHYFVQL